MRSPEKWHPATIEKLLEQLPGPSCSEQRRVWTTMIWIAGRCDMPQPSEAARELETLAASWRGLGSFAQVILLYALREEVEADRADHERLDLKSRLLRAIEAAATRAQTMVRPGPLGVDNAKLCAENIARAYHHLTGEFPPTTDPYGERRSEHPYHRLVRELFTIAKFQGWKEHARKAASHLLAEKGGNLPSNQAK